MKIDQFATITKKVAPITKAALKEFIFELVIDADLVCTFNFCPYF